MMMLLETGITPLREFFSKAYQKTTWRMMKMSQKPKDPTMPDIPSLSKEQLNRLLAADYLVTIANLIRKGAVTGFDFAWDERYEKPQGHVVLSSLQLTAPLEAKLLADMANEKPPEPPIIVEDATEAFKEHGKCENPRCMACNNPNKA
jgi:hypothetical protein